MASTAFARIFPLSIAFIMGDPTLNGIGDKLAGPT
jgi:hypothetical protein